MSEQNSQKTKNITMTKIKKQAIEVNQTEVYEISDTDQITFFPIFPQKKINELLEELREIIIYTEEKDINFDEILYDHVLFLCIKHFTHLKKGISNKFEQQLKQLDYLVDSGYFKIIIEEVFLPEEINKVFDAMSTILSTYQFIETFQQQAQAKLENLKIRNKNMLNVLDHNRPVQ